MYNISRFFSGPIFKHLLSVFIICLFYPGLLFCGENKAGTKFCNITITNSLNKPVALKVEIADSFKSRGKGLMFRKSLDENKGMLFVFESERKLSFWMKNTFIPLSIAYVNHKGVINEIYNMKPLDISIAYPSIYPAIFALEVNRGWFKKNKITIGCRLDISGCLGK